jgi:hypothetical protein
MATSLFLSAAQQIIPFCAKMGKVDSMIDADRRLPGT